MFSARTRKLLWRAAGGDRGEGNVATTMNVYGNASLKAKQQANSKVVQMVMLQEQPQVVRQSVAV